VKAFPHFPLQPIDVRYRHLTSGIGSRTTGNVDEQEKNEARAHSYFRVRIITKKNQMLEWLKIETFFLSARVVGGASCCSRGV